MKATGQLTPDELFDFAVSQPDGFTRGEVREQFSCSSREFDSVVRGLRQILGDDDNIFLVCDPQRRGGWLYKLVGDTDGSRAWAVWMLSHSESRLETELSQARTLVKATDGRSIEGRRARMIERSLRHLREELLAIDEDGRLFGEGT